MNKKLHILFLCGWYPSRVLPTNGDFIERHAKAVSKKHKVTVLHIITDKNLKNDLEVISEEKNNITTNIAYISNTKNPLKKALLFRKALFTLLKLTGNFDVVHLNEIYPFGFFSLYLKWFQQKPFIISEHFTGYHLPQAKTLSFTEKNISRIITKNATFVCPVSNNLKDAMLNLNYKGNYVRVPNVVDTSLFYPLEKEISTFTITHVSNMLNTHKNVEGLLNVVKKLEDKIDNFKVKLIGENANKYIEYANKNNLDISNIEFINQIPHLAVVSELQNSNLFVLFSNYENLPCVILESFSCGIPVISTNVGGINEFFPKDFGFLIPAKDENALLENILKVYKNFKTDKTKMHNYVVENFSEDKIVSNFENLYFKSLKS
mgnify:FL=1